MIDELKQAGLINDKTTSYSINYFNDKTIGADYFSKIKDQNTSSAEKLRLMSSYIAMMAYNSKMSVNQLVRLNNGEIIKKY